MKNRIQNYGLWLAIFAFIPMVVEALTTYEIFVLLPGNYPQLYGAFLAILVIAGILNDPTTDDHGFKDE
jgi:uncharacterized membrane protein